MKTIKVIDLLNKIANGEEVPRKFTYGGYLWEYDINNKMWFYYFGEGKNHRFDKLFYLNMCLNDEAEIIEDAEEDKEIEKLNVALLGQCDNWLEKRDVNIKSDFELNPYIIENIRENTLYFQRKINEVIDIVNKLNKGE